MSALTFNNLLLDVAKKAFDEAAQTKRIDIAAGKCKDHAEYKWQCGIIEGLRIATEAIEAAYSELQKR